MLQTPPPDVRYVSQEGFKLYKELTKENFAKIDRRFDDMTDIMMSGFDRMDCQFDEVGQKFDDLTDIMIGGFDAVYGRFDSKFIEIDRKFDQIDGKLIAIKENIHLIKNSLLLIQSHFGMKSAIIPEY